MKPTGTQMRTEEPDVEYLKHQVMALVGLLSRKGVVPYGEFLHEVHRLEGVDHREGARVVARAWSDPSYKERLLSDARAGGGGAGDRDQGVRPAGGGGEHGGGAPRGGLHHLLVRAVAAERGDAGLVQEHGLPVAGGRGAAGGAAGVRAGAAG